MEKPNSPAGKCEVGLRQPQLLGVCVSEGLTCFGGVGTLRGDAAPADTEPGPQAALLP